MPASTMAEYELSNKADDDLNEIYIFSRQRFGKAKADAYLLALEERFSILARQPRLGRRIDHIRPGYLRYEHVSHSIFYRLTENGIIVMRVLHRRMAVEQHIL
jgi:toxin ParE1/3/4